MKTLIITLFLTLGLSLPTYGADLLQGRALYIKYCAVCHGEFGKGDGPGANTLETKPTNFTDSDLMESITSERIERAIVLGMPDVPEHAFGHLITPEEARDIINYVRSLNR